MLSGNGDQHLPVHDQAEKSVAFMRIDGHEIAPRRGEIPAALANALAIGKFCVHKSTKCFRKYFMLQPADYLSIVSPGSGATSATGAAVGSSGTSVPSRLM